MFSSEEQRPMDSQFAVRVAVLSGIALVAFAVDLLPPLVRPGPLRRTSTGPRPRTTRSARSRSRRPRGEILDRNGKVLVANRIAALAAGPRRRAAASRPRPRNDVLRRLAQGRRHPATTKIKREIQRPDQAAAGEPGDARLATSPATSSSTSRSRQDEFPGVTAEEVSRPPTTRAATSAAHLFGYVARGQRASSSRTRSYEDLDPGDQIGADGLELAVRPLPARPQRRRPSPGRRLRQPEAASSSPRSSPRPATTSCSRSTRRSRRRARRRWPQSACRAASSRCRSRTARSSAMGSYPTFDPDVFTPPVDTTSYDGAPRRRRRRRSSTARSQASIRPARPSSRSPASRRSRTARSARPRSTTTTAPSSSAAVKWSRTPAAPATAPSTMTDGAAGLLERLLLRDGSGAWTRGRRAALQKWACDLGFGQPTGVDLPGEAAGLLPTPEWRNALREAISLTPCGARSSSTRPRLLRDRDRLGPGDNINLAVGQGDLQADPLQMAVAYAAIANGGTVVRPHLAMRVEDPTGAAGRRSSTRRRAASSTSPGTHARHDPRRACTTRRRRRAAPRSRSSATSRSRSPARPAPRERAADGLTSPGTRRSRPTDDPKYVVVDDGRERRLRRRRRRPRSRRRSTRRYSSSPRATTVDDRCRSRSATEAEYECGLDGRR